MFKPTLAAFTLCLFFGGRGYAETPAQYAALVAQVSELVTAVTLLKKDLLTVQRTNEAQSATMVALTNQLHLVTSNPALALGPFVIVDPNPEIGVIGPNITFKGANIHIVSGSGATDDVGNYTGLGNLIIGYDEDPSGTILGNQLTGPQTPVMLQPGDRRGCHNLIIGKWNRFLTTSYGGIVAGEENTITGEGTMAIGGTLNVARSQSANVHDAPGSSVFGGFANQSSGACSTVVGGELNQAMVQESSILGGAQNTINGNGTWGTITGSVNVTENVSFGLKP
jgi:hypothetical protein